MRSFIPLVVLTLGLPLPSERATPNYTAYLKLHAAKFGDINGGSDKTGHQNEFEIHAFTASGGATRMVVTTGMKGLPLVLEALLQSDNADVVVRFYHPDFKGAVGGANYKQVFSVKVPVAHITSVTLHNQQAQITIVAVYPGTIADSLGNPFTGTLPTMAASEASGHELSAKFVVAEHTDIHEPGRGSSQDVPIKEFDWTIGMGTDGKTPGVGTLTFAKDSDATSAALIDAATHGQKLDGTEFTWQAPPNNTGYHPSASKWVLRVQTASFAGVTKIDPASDHAAHHGKAGETYTVDVRHFQLTESPVVATVQW